MRFLAFIFIILYPFTAIHAGESNDDNVRYILIEAPCKPGFPAKTDSEQKVILTNIFKVKFDDPYRLVNAEPELVSDFESVLNEVYPNSRNQVKDILIYMLKTEKEAKELLKRKKNRFKKLDISVIDLKMK